VLEFETEDLVRDPATWPALHMTCLTLCFLIYRSAIAGDGSKIVCVDAKKYIRVSRDSQAF
jgi:hypothetical protein